MADKFTYHSAGLESPAISAAIVTPNDSADLEFVSRGLVLSAAGTVTVDMLGAGENIAIPLQAGWNPIRVKRIYSTGTDSITIVSVW